MVKARLFIGSSRESLGIAYGVQENLESTVEVTVWNQGIFDLSEFSIESLMKALDETDFGLFILSPDDVARIRGEEHQVVRDNVVFELGLFIGRIGRERTFILAPRTEMEVHLPTDLLGITPATFESDRTDGNLQAALGPACNRIKKAIERFGVRKPRNEPQAPEPRSESTQYDENDCISILESWMGSRPHLDNCRAITFNEVDNELGLPAGTAEKYLEQAGQKWGYFPIRRGTRTIIFGDSGF